MDGDTFKHLLFITDLQAYIYLKEKRGYELEDKIKGESFLSAYYPLYLKDRRKLEGDEEFRKVRSMMFIGFVLVVGVVSSVIMNYVKEKNPTFNN